MRWGWVWIDPRPTLLQRTPSTDVRVVSMGKFLADTDYALTTATPTWKDFVATAIHTVTAKALGKVFLATIPMQQFSTIMAFMEASTQTRVSNFLKTVSPGVHPGTTL